MTKLINTLNGVTHDLMHGFDDILFCLLIKKTSYDIFFRFFFFKEATCNVKFKGMLQDALKIYP